MKINYFIKYWLPVILYASFIYYLSSLLNPLQQITPEKALIYFDFHRFIYHILEYAILSLLLYRALKVTSKAPQTSAILITVLYAITDEIHQYFVPGRNANVFDLAIDALGAILAHCITNIYEYLKK
jgi:VanZ family protein